MGWSGGNFTLTFDWTDERDAGNPIDAANMDAQQEEIRAGIGDTRHMGGQNTPTANLPMGGFRHTGVGSAASRTDYAKVAQVQDWGFNYVEALGTVQGKMRGGLSPAITALSSGMSILMLASTASSNKTNMSINSLSTTELVLMDETTVSTDDIVSGRPFQAVFSGGKWWMVSPSHRTALFADVRSFRELSTVDTVTGTTGIMVATTVAAAGTIGQESIIKIGDAYVGALDARAVISTVDATAQLMMLSTAASISLTDVNALVDAAAVRSRDYTGQQIFVESTLTTLSGTPVTVVWDVSSAQVAIHILKANLILSSAQNVQPGGTYIVRMTQDGTGERTLSYEPMYKFPGGVAPTLSTIANSVDILTFTSDGISLFGVISKDIK